MPITFEEMVQAVINAVRDREAAVTKLKQAQARIEELEQELKRVREPDKKPTLTSLPPKEVK